MKKLLLIVLAVALALSLAACQPTEPNTDGETPIEPQAAVAEIKSINSDYTEMDGVKMTMAMQIQLTGTAETLQADTEMEMLMTNRDGKAEMSLKMNVTEPTQEIPQVMEIYLKDNFIYMNLGGLKIKGEAGEGEFEIDTFTDSITEFADEYNVDLENYLEKDYIESVKKTTVEGVVTYEIKFSEAFLNEIKEEFAEYIEMMGATSDAEIELGDFDFGCSISFENNKLLTMSQKANFEMTFNGASLNVDMEYNLVEYNDTIEFPDFSEYVSFE